MVKNQRFFLDGEERNYLLEIKNGNFSSFNSKITELREEIESKRPWKQLPEKADKEFLDNWLIQLRKKELFGTL